MSNNKSQISPIPPEQYGERFVKFISGRTMTKEEVEREAQSADQVDGSIHTHREPSFPTSGRSGDKVVDKAEQQAHKTETKGLIEEPSRDRTLSAVRSPSAERAAGVGGSTLPVVEEDGEAGSREESIRDEKAGGLDNNEPKSPGLPPPVPPKNILRRDAPSADGALPSLPTFNRLSLGLGSSTPMTMARDR